MLKGKAFVFPYPERRMLPRRELSSEARPLPASLLRLYEPKPDHLKVNRRPWCDFQPYRFGPEPLRKQIEAQAREGRQLYALAMLDETETA
jgi:hypothetical protein